MTFSERYSHFLGKSVCVFYDGVAMPTVGVLKRPADQGNRLAVGQHLLDEAKVKSIELMDQPEQA